jgi:hypothetical protein
MWAEQVNSGVIEERIFPHALSVAERAWSPATHFEQPDASNMSSIDWAAIEGRINYMSCHMNRRGVGCSPVAPSYCLFSKTI